MMPSIMESTALGLGVGYFCVSARCTDDSGIACGLLNEYVHMSITLDVGDWTQAVWRGLSLSVWGVTILVLVCRGGLSEKGEMIWMEQPEPMDQILAFWSGLSLVCFCKLSLIRSVSGLYVDQGSGVWEPDNSGDGDRL